MMMKNFIGMLALVAILASCSADEPQKYSLEVLPVESFILPDTLFLGETQTFKIKYKRPSNCHYFEGFYYKKNLNQRTIGITTSVLQENCQPLMGTPVEVELKFFTTNTGNYIFKFFKGEDAAGNNVYESVTVPVKN